MSVIVNNSISLDGFICGPQGYEDWISGADQQYFKEACQAADIIILGSRTFDNNTSLYPIPGKENIVFTKTYATRLPVPGITFSGEDPVTFVKRHNHKNILVAGGGMLNASLFKAGVVSHVTVCVHPIILGAGIKQFVDIDFSHHAPLENLSHRDIGEGVLLIEYKVNHP